MLEQRAELTGPLFLQAAWDILGSPEGPLYQWCVSRREGLVPLRQGGRALEVLLQIAEGTRTTTELGQRIGRTKLSEALQLLVEHDLAERKGMCWMVSDPLLRCWLSGVLAAERLGGRPEEGTTRTRFERYLQTLWDRWAQEHHMSFPEQVAGLFAKFCDETVSLDSKTGRLPKFETIRMQPAVASGRESYLVAEGEGKRWCAAVQEESLDESAVANFEAFCRTQAPRPSRKVIITQGGLDQNARLLAKATNMWVWEPESLNMLRDLYGAI